MNATAGQTDDLDNVPSILDIAGEELNDRTDTVPALWPSDHAAVIVDLRLATT